MRVALISAGPSVLHTFDPTKRYDLRIAVNSAAAVFHCDWWVCGDGQTFERIVNHPEHDVVGVPAILTLDRADRGFRSSGKVAMRHARHRVEDWGFVRDGVHPDNGAQNWSVTMALALAVQQGGREVHVFGHYHPDQAEPLDADCIGFKLASRPEKFTTKRPTNVPTDWATTKSWAQRQGVTITEHYRAKQCV